MKEEDLNIRVELSEATYAQLVALAETHDRTLDDLIRECVQKGLPGLEREVLGEQFVGGTPGPRNQV